MRVSQQAVSDRLKRLPADPSPGSGQALFRRVLVDILPRMHARWQERQRPLPPEVAWAQQRYTQVAINEPETDPSPPMMIIAR